MVKITEANMEYICNKISTACWIDIMYMPLQNT